MKPKTRAKRASVRIASKAIMNKVASKRRKNKLQRIINKSGVWPAVKSLYKPTNVYSAREGISNFFFPIPPRYNATRNTIHRNNRNALKAIQRGIINKTTANIVVPLIGKGSNRAGVNPSYIPNAFRNSNLKYATIGNGNLRAFAFVKNTGPNTRYINVIGAFPSYGPSIMNRILANARTNGKKYVDLKAVTNVANNKNANDYPLVKWYASKGFVRSGTLSNSLLPMRFTVT